jgi:HD-GYP domain-containing protein (c-di-GMP phosphodiesterase class II)
MHDIGKIFVDESILKKGGELDQIEWSQIKKHPEVGYRLLGATIEYHAIADFVLAHHEHWDGSGYPKGLKAEEILWESRAIAIAEAYERMISVQYYSEPLSRDEAIQELRKNAGTQFDPQLVDLFINEVLPQLPF